MMGSRGVVNWKEVARRLGDAATAARTMGATIAGARKAMIEFSFSMRAVDRASAPLYDAKRKMAHWIRMTTQRRWATLRGRRKLRGGGRRRKGAWV